MYLKSDHHVTRYVPYKKQLRDEKDNPIGILPQAFEMRLDYDESKLSVNWVEYFNLSPSDNLTSVIQSFRQTRKVGEKAVFGLGNIGKLEKECSQQGYTKVKVVYDGTKSKTNKTHASIIRLPINNDEMMQVLAYKVFDKIILNREIPGE